MLLLIIVLVVLALCAGTIIAVGVMVFGKKRPVTVAPVQIPSDAQRAELINAAYKRAANRARTNRS